MKKFTAILLLTAYLFSTTELQQLLKLPMVFEHFAAHQKLSTDVSFFQFLDMHYMHGSPKGYDYNEDMKLPFKTADNHLTNLSPIIIPRITYRFENQISRIADNRVITFNDELIPSSYLSSVWQPPKSC